MPEGLLFLASKQVVENMNVKEPKNIFNVAFITNSLLAKLCIVMSRSSSRKKEQNPFT